MYELPQFLQAQPGSYSQQSSYPYSWPTPGNNPQQQKFVQPGNGNQPIYQLPQKRRAGCRAIAILIIVILVGVGVGSYWLFNRPGNSLGNVLNTGPQKTLDAYCDGLKNNNAQELYNTLDAEHQKQTSVNGIQQTLDDLTASGGVKSCTYGNVQINGSTATAMMMITIGSSGDKPYSAPFKLIKENGDWKFTNANINGNTSAFAREATAEATKVLTPDNFLKLGAEVRDLLNSLNGGELNLPFVDKVCITYDRFVDNC